MTKKCICGFIVPLKFANYVSFVVGFPSVAIDKIFMHKLQILMNEVRNFELGEFKT